MSQVRWMLDTCVVSETFALHPEPKVLQWLTAHAAQSALSVVSLGEIQYGIERMPQGRKRNSLQMWFDTVHAQYRDRVLVADEVVWLNWSRLCASCENMGRPQEDFDLLLAATAAANHLTLVTRNTRHFQDTGVPLLDPWQL